MVVRLVPWQSAHHVHPPRQHGQDHHPLAPAFNPERFTDTAKVDKWFRRNCNDVLKRECTPVEKADVLAWLLQFDAKNPPPTTKGAMSHTATTTARARFGRRVRPSAAWLALACALPAAWADSREMPASAMLPAYKQECAGCHMAYPPGMLPASSWSRMMQGLDQHYGTDASLDAAMVRQISTWLEAHAGTYKRVREAPPQDRITQSAWFERKHRDVEPACGSAPPWAAAPTAWPATPAPTKVTLTTTASAFRSENRHDF
jgi:hypothetical protein